jgi:type II secretory pathway component PulF
MPVYEYRALDRAGKNQDGIIDADSPIAARQKLRETGFFPVSVKTSVSSAKGSDSTKTVGLPFFNRIKLGELSVATRQLAILLGAGITLVASLEAMLMQVTNPAFKLYWHRSRSRSMRATAWHTPFPITRGSSPTSTSTWSGPERPRALSNWCCTDWPI